MNGKLPFIYCLNLATSVERRRRMERRLIHHGLLEGARFISADPPPAECWSSENASRACFAGHLKAMRAFLATGEREAIICEDDVLLHNDFSSRLDGVLANLPTDASMCLLGYLIDRWDTGYVWAGRVPERENLCRIVPWWVMGSQMYWISSAHARAVLDQYDGIPLLQLPTMTEEITAASGGYLCYPPLALEEALDSTIRPPADMEFHLRAVRQWPYDDYAAGEEGTHTSPLAHKPTIALCMIVRDESAVIERCLSSVRDLIDTWVICDTGSSDGTPKQIRRSLGGIPGTLHSRPWHDFGRNRTELLQLAHGAADYLLLLDADHTLVQTAPLPPLTADAYLLRHAGELDYAIPRLVRSDRRWWYVGTTHEYLATDGPHHETRLDALVVEDHADGSSRTTKLERDLALLEHELADDPANARAVFYLAQTCRDLGDVERAIELYRRRVKLGGWSEEVFYAAFQAGVLVGRRNPDAGIEALLEAFDLRPLRAEPLHELARLSREVGYPEDAYAYAAQGLALPYPDDVLFVHRPVYDWGLLHEFALAAFETGELETSFDACERLLAEPQLPAEVEHEVRATRERCFRRLGRREPAEPRFGRPLAEFLPSLELGEIRLDVAPAWPQFNPTIAADGDGFRLIVRTANYRLRDGVYQMLDGDERVKTLNYLVAVDRGLELIDVAPIVDPGHGPPSLGSPVLGYEDCRLVELGGIWYATATVRDRNVAARAETVLLQLDGSRVESATVLAGPVAGRHEKNWMPFVAEGELHFVYSCTPTAILACECMTGATRLVLNEPGPPEARPFRGGSQGLAVDAGCLFVVHEALDSVRGRVYLHRFVLFDSSNRLTAISPAFFFVGPGVEFCAGIARRGNDLLLTFGVGDHSAGIAVAELGEALSVLEPVSQLTRSR